MQIKFTKPYADPGERVYQAGETAEVADIKATNLVHYGLAIPVVSKREVAVEKRKKEKRS